MENSLGDKSKEVRAVAVSLLEKLPDSRLVERAKAELEPLLTWKAQSGSLLGALLHRAPGGEIEVQLPEKWRPEWARDGLEEKVSPYNRVRNLGEKAAWLQRFLERVPPSYWKIKWSATPAQVVAGAPQEWRELLIGAWWEAAKKSDDGAWLEAIATQTGLKTLGGMLNFNGLSAQNADSLALSLWEEESSNFRQSNNENGPLRAILLNHPGPWSLELSRLFLQSAREIIAKPPSNTAGNYRSPGYWLRYSLVGFADKIPVELLAEAAPGWPDDDESFGQHWAPVVSQFLARLQLRADLQAEFPPSSFL